jgi:cell division protein FtsI (penicillin-binding protein 3)
MASERRNELLIRVYVFLGMFIVFAGIIFWRAFNISVVEGAEWKAKKDKWYIKEVAIEAERGNIYADDGSLIATSLQFFDIRMDFRARGLDDRSFQKGLDSLAWCLATYVDPSKSVSWYKNWLIKKRNAKSGNRYVRIAKRVSFEEMERIKSFPILRRGPNSGGLIIEQYGRREMPFGPLAERTIGYKRKNAPDVGIEGAFDQYLKGEEGKRYMQKVGHKEFVPLGDVTEIEPERGADLITSLNVNLQDITHHALLRALERHKAEWGTAIVMDVQSGELKAVSNLKNMGDEKYAEVYNFAVGTPVEPGSTFKLASYMALMEDNLIDTSDKVDLNMGYARFCDRDLKDSEPHNIEETDVQTAFAKSSNVGMAKLVNKHYGKDEKARQFIRRLRQFRLDKKTGIEIQGEGQAYIKDAFDSDENWSCTSLPWMAIGYELQLTPLQILTLYNAVANDGQMMKPHLVKKVIKEGKTIKTFKPEVLERSIASKETIEKAKKALEEVVSNGTAASMQSDYYSFAGKTGTTQVGYGSKDTKVKYQSSFVGYFPADEPRYSCLVMVYDPKENGYYGSTVAGPVFKEIADRCFATELKVDNPFEMLKKEKNVASHALPAEHKVSREDWAYFSAKYDFPFKSDAEGDWLYLKLRKDTLVGLPFFKRKETVPDVRGMALKDAVYILENAGLKVEFAGMGKVESQSLNPGTRIEGQKIQLKLG